MSISRTSAIFTLLAVVACSHGETARSDSSAMMGAMPANTTQDSAAMGGDKMGAMQGDKMAGGAMGTMHSDSVAARAEADLKAFGAASPDAAVKMVPAHRAAVEALVADCEQMMRKMKMKAPAKWTRAVADVRQDLSRMSTANASALHAMMASHHEHVDAILSMRHDMMKM